MDGSVFSVLTSLLEVTEEITAGKGGVIWTETEELGRRLPPCALMFQKHHLFWT